MIKTGIYKIAQLKKRDTTLFRKELKNISITLYDQILDEPSSEDIAERILLLFSDERGAYKRTYQKRFEEFDRQIVDTLKEVFATSEPLSVHDAGVSDGRTSLDLFEKISDAFPDIHYTASDYNPCVYLLEKGRLKVVLSHTGKILEITFPPFVFNKMKRDSLRHYPINHFVRFFVEKFLATPLIKQYHQGHVQAKELHLLAPKVLQKAQKDQRVKLDQHDLLQPFEDSSDIIRAMNVLNPSYFSEEEFGKVLRNLHNGLKDDGILIAGSNQEAGTIVHGGIYQKCGNGFKKIYQSGNGASIQTLILNFALWL